MSSPAPLMVIGSGLAAQLAAALLARLGRPVIHLAPGAGRDLEWNSCPPLLVRLLESLDARSCLRPARPLQVITAAHQVELHGGVPLQDELRREFPGSHRQLLDLLADLERLAGRLGEYLWEGEGFPGGWSDRLANPWLRLRYGLAGRGLNRPFTNRLAGFGPDEREWLRTLLAGYACADWEQLSLGEAALVWAELNSPQDFSRSALREQLKNRLVEYSGQWQPVELSAIKLVAEQPLQIVAGAGSHSPAALLSESALSEGMPAEATLPATAATRFSFVEGRPAGHLADRLLVSGPEHTPQRIALQERSGELFGSLQTPPGGSGAEDLGTRLARIFPFCTFRLDSVDTPGEPKFGKRQFLGLRGNLRRTSRSWDLGTSRLLPTLGNTGDCLLAMTLVSRLAR